MNFHGGQFKKDNINDYSVNIPVIEYDSTYRELLIKTIDTLLEYPEIDGEAAREAIAKVIAFPKDNIVLGNGATDLIYLVARSFKFKRAMVLAPTFTEYKRALKQAGSEVLDYIMPYRTLDKALVFDVDAHELANSINAHHIDCLFLCNPNNPTGQMFSTDFLEKMLKNSDQNLVLIIDESFIDFSERGDYHIKMRDLVSRNNILVIRSMTKTYSVPGLRMGYAFGNANLVNVLKAYRDPWALNRFALESIPYLLEKKENLVALQDRINALSRQMHQALTAIDGIHVTNSTANFLLFKVSGRCPEKWHSHMIEKGFYLRTCMDFEGLGNDFFRVAIKDEASNISLINAIRESMT